MNFFGSIHVIASQNLIMIKVFNIKDQKKERNPRTTNQIEPKINCSYSTVHIPIPSICRIQGNYILD